MTDTDNRKPGLPKDSPSAQIQRTEAQIPDHTPVQIYHPQPYRPMVEHSLGLICTHDFDGKLLYVNPAAAKALGYDSSAWTGKNLRDFLAPTFQSFFAEYLQRIRQRHIDEG